MRVGFKQGPARAQAMLGEAETTAVRHQTDPPIPRGMGAAESELQNHSTIRAETQSPSQGWTQRKRVRSLGQDRLRRDFKCNFQYTKYCFIVTAPSLTSTQDRKRVNTLLSDG